MKNIIKFTLLSVIFSAIAILIKQIVLSAVSASPTGRTAGNGMFTLYEVHNSGAAFNILNSQPEMLITISITALIIIAAAILAFSKKLSSSVISSLAFLFSGILMNLVERITHGYVIDYIRLDLISGFPMFNTADIMIVCGTIGILFGIFSKD